mmetsp:Transcript_71898/g.134434  ORF Transcript_71898/g.134434 Transcript_71898/m.134434 type:complete len:251 (-) Transcript_71898:120-872(-)
MADATVSFDVGGTIKKVLAQVVRSKPETLLCTLLDDPARKSGKKPIFIDRNASLFDSILDWYRHGFIILPPGVGMDRMRLECAYYQLPDSVGIRVESLETSLSAVQDWQTETERAAAAELLQAAEQYKAAAQSLVAAAAFKGLVESMRGQTPEKIVSGVHGEVQRTITADNLNFHVSYAQQGVTVEHVVDSGWWSAVGRLVEERGARSGIDCSVQDRYYDRGSCYYSAKLLKSLRYEESYDDEVPHWAQR